MTRALRLLDRPVVIAFGFILVLLILGGIYNQQFLSGTLPAAAAAGGLISRDHCQRCDGGDSARPYRPLNPLGCHHWRDAATAVAGWWGASWTALGVPLAIASGALVGLANGLGVAFLRIPSMVFTLGMNAVVQGMVVMYTGGNAPP